jgi:membrane protein DedA with SNARE-associated domain
VNGVEHFVATYGYVALVVGTFLEGETILVIGGFLAHRGYLDLPAVLAAAFAGSFAGDQLYFHLGRRGGMAALARRPRWQPRADRVFRLLREHQLAVTLGFRFVYGFRTVTPFLLGASGMPTLRFLPLNAVGGALWAACFGTLGYVIGQTLQVVLGKVRRFEEAAVLAIALIGAAAWVAHRFRQARGGEAMKPGSR